MSFKQQVNERKRGEVKISPERGETVWLREAGVQGCVENSWEYGRKGNVGGQEMRKNSSSSVTEKKMHYMAKSLWART